MYSTCRRVVLAWPFSRCRNGTYFERKREQIIIHKHRITRECKISDDGNQVESEILGVKLYHILLTFERTARSKDCS